MGTGVGIWGVLFTKIKALTLYVKIMKTLKNSKKFPFQWVQNNWHGETILRQLRFLYQKQPKPITLWVIGVQCSNFQGLSAHLLTKKWGGSTNVVFRPNLANFWNFLKKKCSKIFAKNFTIWPKNRPFLIKFGADFFPEAFGTQLTTKIFFDAQKNFRPFFDILGEIHFFILWHFSKSTGILGWYFGRNLCLCHVGAPHP